MEWNVVNAQNRDVERQQLNKILKEIRSYVDSIEQSLGSVGSELNQTQRQITNTVTRIIETSLPNDKLATSVTLTGDVTGSSVLVPGQNAVTIQTTYSGNFLQDAPMDSSAYWRRAGQWEAVPLITYYLGELNSSGVAIWDNDSSSWSTLEGEEDGDTLVWNSSLSSWEVGESTGGVRILPVVTGEILNSQPVFVYLDDGSLVYTEV